jgi:hypothetical protein
MLRERDPGKSCYSKAERRFQHAVRMLLDPEDRRAIRDAMRRLSKEQLLDLLGVES